MLSYTSLNDLKGQFPVTLYCGMLNQVIAHQRSLVVDFDTSFVLSILSSIYQQTDTN